MFILTNTKRTSLLAVQCVNSPHPAMWRSGVCTSTHLPHLALGISWWQLWSICMYIYINKFNGIWDIWSTLICGCVWTCWIHQFTAISIGNSTVFPWPNQRMHCKRIQLIPTNTAQSISRMLRFKDLRPIISKIHMYLHLHLHVFM